MRRRTIESARAWYAARLDGDRGAVVIEAALVLPVILVLVAGVIDFGVGFRNRTLVQSATRNGARAGASAVAAPSADQLALSTMFAGLSGTVGLTVDKAIIYEANSLTDGEPSSTCRSIAPSATGAGNASANCNVYGLSQIQAAASVPSTFVGATTYSGGASSTCANGWNRWWCAGGSDAANERTASLSGTVDSFGLYVEATYQPFTGIFTDDLQITDWVVMRMEPLPG